jgi:hypothetical protein
MKFEVGEAQLLLARTPETLRAWLGGLPAAWLDANEGAETFSPREVVGHLVHGEETDWMPRVQRILAYGESVPFVPYDRFAQRIRFGDWPASRLLERFGELRGENLSILRSLPTGADLEQRGTHPTLGRVTLRQLLASWVVHDQNHVAQIARVLAKQYRDEVGPWVEYLPILTR